MAHFLDTPESAYRWAVDNLPDFATYEEAVEEMGEDSFEARQAEVDEERYRERADLYSQRYNAVKDLPTVEIYRIVNVHGVGDIDWDAIGTYWSFRRGGVGSYGHVEIVGGRDVLVVGEVSPKDIDWEHGFMSFLWYGPEQWEAAIKPGVPVHIIEIDGDPVERKAAANVAKLKSRLLR